MSQTLTAPQPPARLLLATDLSPRCDRALDRSVRLARAWGGELTVLNVYGAPDAPDQVLAWATGDDAFDPQQIARRQIEQDLAFLGARADIRLVGSNDVAETVRDVCTATGAGLVITGVARDEPLGRFLLGSSVERLARRIDRPLLVVRGRAHGAYRRIVVASDLSERSRAVLQTATRWFDGAEIALFHAVAAPKALGPVTKTADLVFAGPADQRLGEQFVVDSGVAPDAVSQVAVVEGGLATNLTRYVRRHEVDLVMVGASDGAGLLDALLGNSVGRVLQWVPCDVLVVPAAKT